MVALVEPRRPFIDGKYVPGDGPALAVENPATEQTIAEVETASMPQIEQAIGAARRSFDDGVWSGMPAAERAARYPNVQIFNHQWNNPEALLTIGTIGAREAKELTGGLLSQAVPVRLNRLIF